jgi:tetratricopeptide (TPR) repeat protein
MWEARLKQILGSPPEFLSLSTDPDASERYSGRYLVFDDEPYALGRLLGQGDEALVFELIDLRGGARKHVLKISRHCPGTTKYTKWALPYRIERNPHGLLPDIEMHLAQLVTVPGGLVKVQPFVPPTGQWDWGTPSSAARVYLALESQKPEEALRIVDSLISRHGRKSILLSAKGLVLDDLGRLEEACETLEEALELAERDNSPARLEIGVRLAGVLSSIYRRAPSAADATISIRLDDGTLLSQSVFSSPVASAQDDTLQDRALYVLFETLAVEPYFVPALFMLVEELATSPASYIATGAILKAIRLIDPKNQFLPTEDPEIDHSSYTVPNELLPVSPEEAGKSTEHTQVPASIESLQEQFETHYQPDPVRGKIAAARNQAAIAQLARGDLARAEEAARAATELDDSIADYRLTLADIWSRQGKDDAALQLLQRTSLEFSDDEAVHTALGYFHFQRGQYEAARAAYLRALTSSPHEQGAALTYHQLGRIAQEQRDFEQAQTWNRKALAIFEKYGDENGAALTYHQLGIIAQEQGDFGSAEAWYRKALAIFEKQGDEHGPANTYGQLGTMAQDQGDFEGAEAWHRKALAIFEKQGDERGAAIVYHQLGMIAAERGDFGGAEAWYRKALAIFEKQGDEHRAALTYHQLGRLAEEQGDFEGAEAWYRKALAIFEKQGDEYGAANTYGQLGVLTASQKHYEQAGQLFLKAISRFVGQSDLDKAQITAKNFRIIHEQAGADAQAKLKAMWDDAELDHHPFAARFLAQLEPSGKDNAPPAGTVKNVQ